MAKTSWSLFFLLICNLSFSQTAEDERLAIQFFQLREYDKAEILLKKQYEINPTKFYDYLYKTYFQLRKYSEAGELTRQVLKSNAKNLNYKYNLGKVYEKLNDSLQAKKEWSSINALIGDNEYEANNFLQKYAESRNWSMAEDLIIQYQKKSKNKDAFISQLLGIYVKQDRMEKVIAIAISQLEQDNVNYLYLYSSYDFLSTNKTAQRLMEKKLFAKLNAEPNSDKWNELAMQLAMTVKDYEQALILAKSFEKRGNGQGMQVYQIAEMAANENEFDIAIDGFDYVIKTNSTGFSKLAKEKKIGTLYSRLKKLRLRDSTNLSQLQGEIINYLQQYGYNQNTAEIQLMYAEFTVKYLKRLPQAMSILEKMLESRLLAKQHISRAKLNLADIKLALNDIWEASLLYGQVDKDELDGPLGEEARFKNSKVFYFDGDYELAEDLLSILKSSTSELIANDALQLAVFIQENKGDEAKELAMKDVSNAELLFYQNRTEEAVKTLASLKRVFPNSSLIDDVLMIEANYEKSVENESAAAVLYKELFEKFPTSILADRALYEWAKLQEEQFNNAEYAKEAYLNLLTKYKDSVFSTDARKRLRKLRGENLEDEI
jgi:tetratricopeptide (TPR) repeat protein